MPDRRSVKGASVLPVDFRPHYLILSENEDVAIAEITLPRLTEEENIEQLGVELFALSDQFGCTKIVVDLNSVEYTTSSVLGKLISLHRKLHRNGGKLVLCNPRTAVTDVLRTSHLLEYFNVAESRDAALDSFGDRGANA